TAGGALAKYSSTGDLLWAVPFDGSGYTLGRGLALDSAGNPFVAGMFTGSATFGSGGNAQTLISAGMRGGFVVKYASTGLRLAAYRIGGPEDDELNGVAVDGNGRVVTTGYYKGDWNLLVGNTIVLMHSHGGADVLMAKFSNALYIGVLRGAGGTEDDYGTSV